MKRIFTVLTAVLLFLYMPGGVSAAGTNRLDDAGRSVGIDVKAVYKENADPNVYKDDASDGASITTKNGITVIISGGGPGARLVVREITSDEREAYEWFSGVMRDFGTGILPYDVYFERAGQRFWPNAAIQVGITFPKPFTTPLACTVTPDGTAADLDFAVKDHTITFEADHAGYYVFAEKLKKPRDIPQTGDGSNPALYGLMLFFPIGLVLLMTAKRREKVS